MNSQNKEITEYNGDNSGGAGKNNKINLPNKLTILRIILVPVYMIFILLPDNPVLSGSWSNILAAALVLIAALTDLLDGIIARRLKLITDFGKFLDPLADKFMIVGAMFAITASDSFKDIKIFTVWITAIIFFRELAVTSIRLVAKSSDENVISANFAGKLKTFSQIVCVMTILLEAPVITQNLNAPAYLFSYITMGVMLIFTVYSGFVYFKTYWNYIDPAK